MSPLEETRIGCGRPLQASLDADDILGRLLAAGAWHALVMESRMLQQLEAAPG